MKRSRHSLFGVLFLTGVFLFLAGADVSNRFDQVPPISGAERLLDSAPESVHSRLIIRNPYIQAVDQNSFGLHWKTILPVRSRVIHGPDVEMNRRVESEEAATTHSVRIEGYEPGERVYYQVLGPDGEPLTPVESTRTAPAPKDSGEIRIAVFGDSGLVTRHLWKIAAGEDQLRVARQIELVEPDLILHTGDLVYNNGERENYDPLFFLPYRNLLGRALFLPTLGNHDVMTESGAPYFENFDLPLSSLHFPERYYSVDYGNVHLISLDGTYLDSLLYREKAETILSIEEARALQAEQIDFLRRDLRKAAGMDWIIVFFHHPAYSTARIQSTVEDRFKITREDWVPLFEEFGVDLVFNGHEHTYERFHPIREGVRNDEEGVTYVVTGGGGGKVRDFAAPPDELTAHRVPRTHHFVSLQIEGPHLRLAAIDGDGNTIDSWAKTKPEHSYLLGEGIR